MTGVLVREGKRWGTHEHREKVIWDTQWKGGIFSRRHTSETSGKIKPANTLILDFKLSELWENTYVCFFFFKEIQSVVFCYGSFSTLCCSVVKLCLFATPWTAACQHALSFTISPTLLKLFVHWVGDALQPSHSLSSPSLLASIFPTIRVFSSELAHYESIGASVSAPVLPMNI